MLLACSGSDGGVDARSKTDETGNATNPDGDPPSFGQDGPGASDPVSDCSERDKLIQIVAQNTRTRQLELWHYDPESTGFVRLGPVTCPELDTSELLMAPAGAGAVARSGTVFVHMADWRGADTTPDFEGDFRIDTRTGSCELVRESNDVYLFNGSAFSSDAPGSTKETWFTPLPFGTLNPKTLERTAIRPLPWRRDGFSAILIGSGEGELFGLAWFPSNPYPPIEFHELDKKDGSALTDATLDSTQLKNSLTWSFSMWGGLPWLFSVPNARDRTIVTKYDLATGAATNVLETPDFVTLVAGTSTCAPTKPPIK